MSRPDDPQLAFALGDFGSQRWKNGRVAYKPPGAIFDPRRAEARPIDDREARPFVEQNHYSTTYVASRYRTGLYIRQPFAKERLVGVAVFSVPMSQAVTPRWLGVRDPNEGVELGRLVLLDDDDVGCNSESWFVARSLRLLAKAKPSLQGVVAFCDPVERRTADGRLIKRGHAGVVYRSTNAAYRGRSTARTLLLTPAGTVLNARSLSKLRNEEVGADYVERQLRDAGAPPRWLRETPRNYVDRLVASQVLRKQAHPGNLTFTWCLKRQAHRCGAGVADGCERC